jgi:L-2-hydroxyglutarate oxidase LhgO
MSVPHLDTRIIDGKKGLLFGPYAGWTPKFLKQGSWMDLFKSLRPGNIPSYLGVAVQELGLTKYLVEEVLKDQAARVESLREYMPERQRRRLGAGHRRPARPGHQADRRPEVRFAGVRHRDWSTPTTAPSPA